MAQHLVLPTVTRTAEHNGGAQVGEAAIIVDRGFDLGGQFARRFEHERSQSTALLQAGENR